MTPLGGIIFLRSLSLLLPLLQECQGVLRQHIGLSQHSRRGLRQNLRPRERGDLRGDIGIADRRF